MAHLHPSIARHRPVRRLHRTLHRSPALWYRDTDITGLCREGVGYDTKHRQAQSNSTSPQHKATAKYTKQQQQWWGRAQQTSLRMPCRLCCSLVHAHDIL